jgi:hypothetical protein
MKKLIALIVLMSGLAVTAQAETKVLIVDEANPEKSITIKAGQLATVVFWGMDDLNNSSIVEITVGTQTVKLSTKSFSVDPRQGSYNYEKPKRTQPNFIPVVPGPATIKLSKSAARSSMITVKIENDSGVGDGNNVTVIPDSVDDSTLVLEGSDDMVNWTVETLGDKPKATRKKFYRLRAKKE